ncbi:MAG: response regulator transcription factor [Burkholderiaceae bacterium]|nr:response regulator transcription factor [Burkholderiaceae bacterium]
MTEPGATAEGGTTDNTIKVFLAEDHHVTLWGLQQLIEALGQEMTVVGTARTCSELMNHDGAALADVIVLDLDLGGEDATAALPVLRQRCSGQVLVLTGSDDVDAHRAAVLKGARGVLHKSESAQTVLLAIRKVHQGEIWLGHQILGAVLDQLQTRAGGNGANEQVNGSDPDAERIASLTPRERQIVRAMVNSPGDKQFAVADQLGMSEHTLRNHLTTIYSKLDVRGRLELHVYATAHGLGAEGWVGDGAR